MKEADACISTFRTAPSPEGPRLSGLFAQRWCDFIVHELDDEGQPETLREIASTASPAPSHGERPVRCGSECVGAPEPPGSEYAHFVMYKQNRTTADALQQLASAAGVAPTAFAVRGTKDRRAITTQRVSARQVPLAKLLQVNRRACGVLVGHVRGAAAHVRLGTAPGNHFTVVLRELMLLHPHTTVAPMALAGTPSSPVQPSERPALGCDTAPVAEKRVQEEGLRGETVQGKVVCLEGVGAEGGGQQEVRGEGLLGGRGGEEVTGEEVRGGRGAQKVCGNGAQGERGGEDGARMEGVKSGVNTEAPGPSLRAAGGAGDGAAEALRLHCAEAAAALAAGGFINYFGLQRFGTGAGPPTHVVGGALLRGEHFKALTLILSPDAPGVPTAARPALRRFSEDGNAAAALRSLPPRRTNFARRMLSAFADALAAPQHPSAASQPLEPAAEPSGTECAAAAPRPQSPADATASDAAHKDAAALAALRARMPRRQLLLYVNAVQSLAWNAAASARLRDPAMGHVLEGDLVRAPTDGNGCDQGAGGDDAEAVLEGLQGPGSAAGLEGADDAAPDETASGGAGGADLRRAPLPETVRALGAAEAASGVYSLEDVVLPLPGHAVVYPRGQAAVRCAYEDALLRRCGIDPALVAWHSSGLFDLPGAYRPLIANPRDLRFEVLGYDDHTAPLAASDLDRLRGCDPPARSAAAAAPQHWALRLDFRLPTSSFATMCVRELLKEPLEPAEQKQRSKVVLAAQYGSDKAAAEACGAGRDGVCRTSDAAHNCTRKKQRTARGGFSRGG